jgi:hypothetical protein
MRRGDIFAVPVSQGPPFLGTSDEEIISDDEEDDDYTRNTCPLANELVYFKVTTLNYEPLVALEDDFRSSVSSKGRAGEFGCWVDVGDEGTTKLVLEGLERDRVTGRDASRAWHGIREWLLSSVAPIGLTKSQRGILSPTIAMSPIACEIYFCRVSHARLSPRLSSFRSWSKVLEDLAKRL